MSKRSLELLIEAMSREEMGSFVTNHFPKIPKHAQRLFETLWQYRGHGRGISEAEVNRIVFGEPYEMERDYLLRNQRRHLAKEIRIFLSLRAHEKALRSGEKGLGVEYLDELAQRSNPEFVKKEYKLALRKASRRAEPEVQFELKQFYASRISNLLGPSRSALESSISLFQEALQAARQTYNFRQRELENQVLRARLNLKTMDVELPGGQPPQPLLWPELNHPYLEFLKLRASSYLPADPEERINFLHKALDKLDRLNLARINPRLQRCGLLNNLGVAYLNQQSYAQAAACFKDVLNNGKVLSAQILRAVRLNYLTAQMGTGDFSGALKAMEASLPLFQKDPRISIRVQCMRVMALLRLGQTKEAKQVVPTLMDQGSEDNHYYLRLCMTIAFFMENEMEMAFRENTNLIQSTHYQKAFQHYAKAARLFNRLINLGEFPEVKPLSRLKTDSQQFFSHELGPLLINLPLSWLRERIAEMGKGR